MPLKPIALYLIATITFFAIDLTWLGLIARKFYFGQLGHLMKTDINWIAAITFYLIFIVGILVFAVYPAINSNSIQKALILGALFGFIAYATYDLTNLATLKDWPVKLVVVDMIWGAVLSASVATITYYLSRYINL
jgi:uncharacterized membrane protein